MNNEEQIYYFLNTRIKINLRAYNALQRAEITKDTLRYIKSKDDLKLIRNLPSEFIEPLWRYIREYNKKNKVTGVE